MTENNRGGYVPTESLEIIVNGEKPCLKSVAIGKKIQIERNLEISKSFADLENNFPGLGLKDLFNEKIIPLDLRTENLGGLDLHLKFLHYLNQNYKLKEISTLDRAEEFHQYILEQFIRILDSELKQLEVL